MAILAFQKPDKVIMLEADQKFGKFEFRPLEPGFGITIGNALRRILLSSLEGFAINTIKIEGVEHEFATVPGVKEDVTNIILNLKQVRFKQIVEEVEKGISRLDMLGIKGKDYDDYKDFVDCYYADERRKGLANDFETFAKEDIKKEKMNFKELQEEMEKYDGFKEPKHGVTKKDVSAVKDALIRENAYAR